MAFLEQTLTALENGGYDGQLSKVYTHSELDSQKKRLNDVLSDFSGLYDGNRDIHLFSAPGRTEVCGNHTDHNHGKVLAAAISLDAIAAAAKRDDNIINVKSRGYKADTIDCSNLEPVSDEKNSSAALIRGVAARFVELGYKIGGFDAATTSNVLKGSGMSSSAAFEVLIGTILNHLYNGGTIDPVEIAMIAQFAENKYFGKPCGLMDQMACSVGSFVTIDFCDPCSPVVKKVDFDLSESGFALCIVDTKGDHASLTNEYAAVRSEMEDVADFFGKKVLREVDEKDFYQSIADIRAKNGDRAVLRAMHFFADNARVDDEVDALDKNDLQEFLSLVVESGRSSYMYNQNVYVSKSPKNQPVSVALALSEQILKGKGAWRVHGGGFAGTIQAFVPLELVDDYTNAMSSVFGCDSCHILNIRCCGGVKLT